MHSGTVTPVQLKNHRLRVMSGNLMTCQAVGVHHSVDYEHAGFVRGVATDKITAMLDGGDIVLLDCIGHSLAGKTYMCRSDEVRIVQRLRVAVFFGVPPHRPS